MKLKITHLTSAHNRYDTRIFQKMCVSLARQQAYYVSLIVADGRGNELVHRVDILDVGAKSGNRFSRMTKTVGKVFEKAKELNSDIYHLHDPELIPIGLKLKKLGKKVIFDAHEDLPKQILGKPYLSKPVRIILSKTLEIFEKYSCRKFDYIITATPYIKEKFLNINKNSLDINNYPIIDEFTSETHWSQKGDEVCYVGDISKNRGIFELIKSLEFNDSVRLNLAGTFSENTAEIVKEFKGWERVNELGFLDRKGVAEIYQKSKAGIVTLYPIINYLHSLPVKMFEYMAAGLPVICSDIPLWKGIIEKDQCGITINPFDPEELAKAINYIIDHPLEAEVMGKNGSKAVEEKYNWKIEEDKLYGIYNQLANCF